VYYERVQEVIHSSCLLQIVVFSNIKVRLVVLLFLICLVFELNSIYFVRNNSVVMYIQRHE